MTLSSILEKTKASYIAVSSRYSKIIDSVEEEDYPLKKEFTSGGHFFFEMGSDFLNEVLKGGELEEISLNSKESNILFIKNEKGLVFYFLSKNELNTNIIKLIIDKYDTNN